MDVSRKKLYLLCGSVLPLMVCTGIVYSILSIYLHEELGIDLQEQEVETLGGFLMKLFNKIPKAGDSTRFKNMTFVIDEIDKNRIKRVTIKKQS